VFFNLKGVVGWLTTNILISLINILINKQIFQMGLCAIDTSAARCGCPAIRWRLRELMAAKT